MNNPIIPVILCGGAGTRLWPLSRKNFPKPFLKVGQESLIAQTVRRAAKLLEAGECKDMLLVSNEAYQFLLRDECQPVLQECAPTVALHQLLEPNGRNTGPAIALAALWASQNAGDKVDPVLLVLPADHLINPIEQFVQAAGQAVASAISGKVTCFGINPTTPETGFGYIHKGSPCKGLDSTFTVNRFVEKPDLQTAMNYLASGEYLWNGGMFAFKASVLIAEMQEHCPELLHSAKSVWEAREEKPGQTVGFSGEAFSTLPDLSIDYALMEKSANTAVVPSHFQWSDIGSWEALALQSEKDSKGNSRQGGTDEQLIQIDCENTHVKLGNRTVATLGLKDLIVVDTPDALLIADRSRHQQVKDVVARLKSQKSTLIDFHPTVHRPWGTYTVLEEAKGYKIKRIEVKQGASLSLQMHHHRSEHWIVVSGTAEVTNGEQTFLVRKNESTYIPAGNRHRLTNPGVLPLVMIEVQSGDYLEEDDIVRFDDRYGRA